MVGISLALQLGAALPGDTSILLVEGFPLAATEETPTYHPSFDARSTALSYSSRLIYEQCGVWSTLEQWVAAIETIHVSSRGRLGSSVLRADDYDWSALGYVIENAWLGRALLHCLHAQGRVELRSPHKVVAVQPNERSVTLQLHAAGTARESDSSSDAHDTTATQELEAGLLLVADGAASGLRERLGVAVDEKPYGQHAVIANIASAQPHNGCAFERFTDEGPLALLPLLATPESDNRSALVWTLAPDRAAELLAASDEDFLRELQNRFGYRLGRLQRVGERHDYPLTLVTAQEQVRQSLVVMGNAAHALHPVAGQGFNLALRDIAALAAVLAEGLQADLHLGELSTLQRYHNIQREDQARTIAFSDRVPSLFMHPDPVLGLGRDLALAGLDILPALKQQFVRYAAGVAGMQEVGRG